MALAQNASRLSEADYLRLERQSEARRVFDTLSYSRQQALVLPIIQARTPETRQRRIDKALTALREPVK